MRPQAPPPDDEYMPDPSEFEPVGPRLVGEDDPMVISSARSRWRGPAAERAADVLATHPAVFHDETDSLVWVRDQRRAIVLPLNDTDMLAGLYEELGVRFAVTNKEGAAPVPAPEMLLRRVLTGRWPNCSWRLLRGMTDGPYILASGEVVTSAGYEPRTGLWMPQSMVVDLPMGKGAGQILERGYNQKTAAKATEWLLSELAEFPWQDPAVDRAVWLAYLFTLVSRPAYEEAPFFLVDAPHSGSGKDLLLKCAELVAHGREARRISFLDDPYQDENRIATLINDGYTTGVIGDLRTLDNKLLIALITEGRTYTLRTLGKQVGMKIPYNLTLAGTGHNVRFKEPDMIRRSLRLRLCPDQPNPEERPKTKFNQAQLRAWFLDNRQRALAAVLNTIRGFLLSGETPPSGVDPKAFPAWGAMVQGSLLWAGQADPVASQASLREAMLVRSGDPMGELISAWWKAWHQAERKASDLLALIEGNPNGLTSQQLAIRDAIRGLSDKPIGPKFLKAILSDKRDEVYVIEDEGVTRRVRLLIFERDHVFRYRLDLRA